ncbi:hypothetical protein N9R79_04350 [Vibrio sp.]|nr:hypothetical protein [Vibrio sp.]
MYLSIALVVMIIFVMKELTVEQWVVISLYTAYSVSLFFIDIPLNTRIGMMYQGIPTMLLLMHIFPFIFKVDEAQAKWISIPISILLVVILIINIF